MKFYFAPLEGITGFIYRNAHANYFGHMDKYFSPFISANQSETLKSRERKGILPQNNVNIPLIPQIMANDAGHFVHTLSMLTTLGYTEANLNLGCPSKTVTSRGRGAGFLARPEHLDRFLHEIFAHAQIRISVKTRTGIAAPEEFHSLLQIFNQYPIAELIIHPRLAQDFYNNKPNLEIFEYALQRSVHPVCYNGDIYTLTDYRTLIHRFPRLEAVMLGRGLLANPALVATTITGKPLEKATLKQFHDRLNQEYFALGFNETNVLYKMKELWFYLSQSFSNSEKHAKQIRKAQKLSEYIAVVENIFAELPLTVAFQDH